jgi:hypothetical protein
MHKLPAQERPAWEELGPEVGEALRPVLPALVDETIEAVGSAVPVYEGVLDRGVRTGVRQALEGFVELIEAGDEAQLPGRGVYVAFGRGEMRAGRSLDALLTAYRAGAQVAWRRCAEAGDRAGLEPRVLYKLAEAIFAYIDELSAASAEGHAEEQSLAAREREERRGRLLERLLRHPPPTPEEAEEGALAAAWQLPERLAAMAFEGERPGRVALHLPRGSLVARIEGSDWALIPHTGAPAQRGEIEAALRGARGALGPAVPWPETWRSAERASIALEAAKLIADEPLLIADDHLLELILFRDVRLAEDLATGRLQPLDGLRPVARQRLSETLRAWLDHQGEVRPTAEALHVHVQTVRYRVGQLRELLGEDLDEPRGRLELALALRAREAYSGRSG